jgi:hypothetical protein
MQCKFIYLYNNNNENNVVVINETIPIPPPPPPELTITCEECFEENLTPNQLEILNEIIRVAPLITSLTGETLNLSSLEQLYILFTIFSEDQIFTNVEAILLAVNSNLPSEPIPESIIEEIILCIVEALGSKNSIG